MQIQASNTTQIKGFCWVFCTAWIVEEKDIQMRCTTYRHDELKWIFVDSNRGLILLHHFYFTPVRKENSNQLWWSESKPKQTPYGHAMDSGAPHFFYLKIKADCKQKQEVLLRLAGSDTNGSSLEVSPHSPNAIIPSFYFVCDVIISTLRLKAA